MEITALKKHFQQIKRIHNANLWVQFFANGHPIKQRLLRVPEADAPDLPPIAPQYRPSTYHAMYQAAMAEGIALGITSGYGEDYKAETYMPIPTVMQDDIDIMGRKHLTAGLAAAQYPHFVALYTDFYGHLDIMGAGEISSEEINELRNAAWDQATQSAGIREPKPFKFYFNPDKMPKDLQKLTKDKKTRKIWKDHLSQELGMGSFRNLNKWLDKNYPSQADRLQLWNSLWAKIGVTPAPQPGSRVPVPTLDKDTASRVGPDATYKYAAWMLSGFNRAYGAFTKMVESELPAVFTIHNKGTMNHSAVSHAWAGYRSPNIDPAYMGDGASAVSVSEWNLDGVPKPYFSPRFIIERL